MEAYNTQPCEEKKINKFVDYLCGFRCPETYSTLTWSALPDFVSDCLASLLFLIYFSRYFNIPLTIFETFLYEPVAAFSNFFFLCQKLSTISLHFQNELLVNLARKPHFNFENKEYFVKSICFSLSEINSANSGIPISLKNYLPWKATCLLL